MFQILFVGVVSLKSFDDDMALRFSSATNDSRSVKDTNKGAEVTDKFEEM
jgi:hypothetical protein